MLNRPVLTVCAARHLALSFLLLCLLTCLPASLPRALADEEVYILNAYSLADGTLVIEGGGFCPDPACNQVRIDGRAVPVREARPGLLKLAAPTDLAPCTQIQLSVVSGDSETLASKTLTVAQEFALAPSSDLTPVLLRGESGPLLLLGYDGKDEIELRRYRPDGPLLGSRWLRQASGYDLMRAARAPDGTMLTLLRHRSQSHFQIQRYARDGEALGPPRPLPGFDYARQPEAFAAGPAGGFVLVWEQDDRLLLRRFDAQARPLGDPQPVSDLDWPQEKPRLAMAANGDLLISWIDGPEPAWEQKQPWSWQALRVRAFDPGGRPRGPSAEFGRESGAIYSQDLALNPRGEAIAVWPAASSGSGQNRIRARRLTLRGQVLEAPLTLVAFPALESEAAEPWLADPRVAIGPTGDFALTWRLILAADSQDHGYGHGYSYDYRGFIQARFFNARGWPRSPAQSLSSCQEPYPGVPLLWLGHDDHALALWFRRDYADQSDTGVYGRFFTPGSP